MSMITLSFESYKELTAFARDILGIDKETADLAEESTAQTETPKPQPDSAVPYGQQIAPHFPEANTGAATAAQATQDPAPNMTPLMQPATQPAPAPQTPPTQPAAVPTAEHTYTAEELQVAAVTLVDKGMMAQLQEMLHQFGVNSLPELPAEKYGAFATALRGMGAQI